MNYKLSIIVHLQIMFNYSWKKHNTKIQNYSFTMNNKDFPSC